MTMYYWVLSEETDSVNPPREAEVVKEGNDVSVIRWKDTEQTQTVRTSQILVPKVHSNPRNRVAAETSQARAKRAVEPDKDPSPQENKRSKVQEVDSNQNMPLELLRDHILPLLRPRELLNVVCTSKFLLSQLSHELVIRSAVVPRTGPRTQSQKRMRELAKLLKKRHIYIPSPLRLLRLLLGTRCEQPGCLHPCQMKEDFALFMCDQCQKHGTPSCPHRDRGPFCTDSWQIHGFGGIPDSVRQPLWDSRYRYVMNKPYTAPTGERAGPIFTMRVVDQLVKGVCYRYRRRGRNLVCDFSTLTSLDRPSQEECNKISEIYDDAVYDAEKRKPLTLQDQKFLVQEIPRLPRIYLLGAKHIIREAGKLSSEEGEIHLELDQLDTPTQRKLLRLCRKGKIF